MRSCTGDYAYRFLLRREQRPLPLPFASTLTPELSKAMSKDLGAPWRNQAAAKVVSNTQAPAQPAARGQASSVRAADGAQRSDCSLC